MTTVMELREQVQARRDLPPPPMRRALREAAGLSLEEVARVVGVSRQAIAHWELDQRRPRPQHVQAYLAVLRELQRMTQ